MMPEALSPRCVPHARIAGALLGLAFALAPLAAGAAPPERRVGLEDQTAVAVTIYNEDLALVRDQRLVALDSGANRLAFVDVSAAIRPETALLRAEGGSLATLEQNFNFDLLTPEKLLEKSVGRKIRIIRTHPQTGAETVEEGTLLSVASGVVVQIGDRIETQPPGRIVFADVPPDLRARPTLVLDVDSGAAGRRTVELSYLTGGLGWRADYVARLNPAEDRLDLDGWVTLTNTSGTTYRDAKLQLVAGQVNRVREELRRKVETTAMAEMSPAPPPMAEEALFEYHLYTLGRPTTIAENQTKQVALLSASAIPVKKEYRFEGLTNFYAEYGGEQPRVNAAVRIMFDNKESEHLGMPLPKGIMRVYKADSAGQALFVGEDGIDHTPKNETVRLSLGQAFDVTAQAKQTDFEKISRDTIEAAYEIELKNAKTEPVTVTVAELIPGDWKVLGESQPHVKTNAHQIEWQVPVPAGGKTVLTYRVRVKS